VTSAALKNRPTRTFAELQEAPAHVAGRRARPHHLQRPLRRRPAPALLARPRKRLRRYKDRWKIFVDNQYDQDTDIKFDVEGLLQLRNNKTPRSIKLRDEIMEYFRGRNEDMPSES